MSRVFGAHKGFVVLVSALFGCLLAVGAAQAVTPPHTSTFPPTATRGVNDRQPAFAPSPSAASTASAVSNYAATKEAVLDHRATNIASVPKVAPAIKGPPALSSNPTSTPQTGILDIQIAPFNAHEGIIANRWQGVVAGQFVVVYAGRQAEPADQGLVAVSASAPGDTKTSVQKYPTPTRSGSVKITGMNGTQLTLKSEQGTTFTFDVASRTFR